MRKAMTLVVLALLALTCVAFADAQKVNNANLYQSQVDQLKLDTRSEIDALNQQLEGVSAEEQEQIHAQIQALKLQSEISRLEILLEWARSENDEARIVEVETALQNFLNPPVKHNLPDVPRDKSAMPGQSDSNTK